MPAQDIFIISEDAAVRHALSDMVRAAGLGMPLPFDTSQLFMQRYDSSWRGCVLLDVRMSAYDGLKLQRHRQMVGCSMPLLFILVEQSIPVAVELVTGYDFTEFDGPQAGEALIGRVREALRWHEAHCARVAEKARLQALYDTTTRREREVFNHLARGRTNKQIGTELGVSPRTVEIYRGRLLQKLQAASLADLVRISMLLSAGSS